MTAHAYWRVRLYQYNGANAALTKVEFRDVVGGTDQATGGTAIASDVYSGSFAAAFAFNNNADYWASHAANGEWIGYHFPAPVSVGEVVLTSRSDIAQYPGFVEIGSSDDGVTWNQEWGINPTRFNAQNQTIAFAAPDRGGAHSYWRINVSANNGGANVQIGEARFRSRSGELFGQAVNGTADASSWFSGAFIPELAFDNDINTGWANASGTTGILSYHFLVPVAVAELELVSPNNSTYNAQAPKDFKVQYSDDNVTWFDAWSVVGSVGWSAGESRVFTRPVSAPDQPTITLARLTENSVRMTGSAFVGVASHVGSYWELTHASDPTFAAPVFQSGLDAVHLVSRDATAVDLSYDVIARVRYKDSNGSLSPWSNASATLLALAPPDTPTISVSRVTSDSLRLTGSAFSHPQGDTHASTDWQITASTDPTFAAPTHVAAASADLILHDVAGLPNTTSWIARARYRSNFNQVSAWSATTDATDTITAPTIPTLTVDEIGETSAHLHGSPFSGSEEHTHTQWQVALASDPTFVAPIFAVDVGLPELTLPAGTGVLRTDIDPLAFPFDTQVDGTALTELNTIPSLTPMLSSPTWRENIGPGMRPAIRMVMGISGFKIPRPVEDNWTIYAVVRNPIPSSAAGAQWHNNSTLIDSEKAGAGSDFGLNLEVAGTLVAGVGGPDSTAHGSHSLLGTDVHVITWRRYKNVGGICTIEVHVDGVRDFTYSPGNTGTLNFNPYLYFGIGESDGACGYDLLRFRAYDTTHTDLQRVEMENALIAMYVEASEEIPPLTDFVATGLPSGVPVLARVRYRDAEGNYSPWSLAVPFTLLAPPDPPPELPWIPKFIVGIATYQLSLPVTRWIPGEQTVGSIARTADTLPGVEVRRRKYTLGFNLRFYEDEWPVVRSFIRSVQSGRPFLWFPNPDGESSIPESLTVILDSPRTLDSLRPVRDTAYPHVMYLGIVLSSRSVFAAYYFPEPAP